MTSPRTSFRYWLIAGLLVLSACGGGGRTNNGTSEPVATLTGTAAIGAALVGGVVQVLDRTGASACSDSNVRTDAQGRYSCNLTPGSLAPMVVVVTDPAGLLGPLVSVLVQKPASGETATANVTPLTTAVVAQVAGPDRNPYAFFESPALLAGLDTAALGVVSSNLVAQLASVLPTLGLDPSFDPLTTTIVGGSGAGADGLLDLVRVSFVNGGIELSNALNPTAPSVPMAGTDTSVVATLSAPVTVTGGFAISELDVFQAEMQRCFAVPSTTRAPNHNTATLVLTGAAKECKNFFASAGDVPNVDLDFLNNGYGPEAYFYRSFTSEFMDDARFNRPELMRFEPRDNGRHMALLNLKYTDAAGFPGNFLLVATKFPSSRPAGQSQWWLTGNQRLVDASITTDVRRRDQTLTDFDTYQNAGVGRFDNGLRIAIRRGSLATPNNPNTGIWYVRVRGPALPTAGMVLADLPIAAASDLMGFLNADGLIPAGPQQLAGAGASSTLRLQRTVGLEGTAARTVRPNPNVANPLSSVVSFGLNFAHPNMYGQTPSSTWVLDVSGVVPWASYTFEAFDGNSTTTPLHTWTARLVAPLVPADQAVFQPWHGRGASTTQFLTLGAPAVGTVTVDWVNNPLAQRVQTVWAQSYLNSSNAAGATVSDEVFSDFVSVPRGATAALVTAAGTGAQWQSLVPPTTTSRIVTLQYQMLDGSRKQEQRFFN